MIDTRLVWLNELLEIDSNLVNAESVRVDRLIDQLACCLIHLHSYSLGRQIHNMEELVLLIVNKEIMSLTINTYITSVFG